MLEDTVGELILRKGLNKYLQDHQFSNAVTNDLWHAISQEWQESQVQDKRKKREKRYIQGEQFSVSEMMDTWTLQMGYPIIMFDQHNDSNIYTIKQTR